MPKLPALVIHVGAAMLCLPENKHTDIYTGTDSLARATCVTRAKGYTEITVRLRLLPR